MNKIKYIKILFHNMDSVKLDIKDVVKIDFFNIFDNLILHNGCVELSKACADFTLEVNSQVNGIIINKSTKLAIHTTVANRIKHGDITCIQLIDLEDKTMISVIVPYSQDMTIQTVFEEDGKIIVDGYIPQ